MNKHKNYEKVALSMLTCSTFKEVSEKTGISIATIRRYRHNKEFQEILENVKQEIYNETIQKAQGYCLESLNVLKSIMNDKTATDSARVSAARTIIEFGINVKEQEAIIDQIKEIERRIEI